MSRPTKLCIIPEARGTRGNVPRQPASTINFGFDRSLRTLVYSSAHEVSRGVLDDAFPSSNYSRFRFEMDLYLSMGSSLFVEQTREEEFVYTRKLLW